MAQSKDPFDQFARDYIAGNEYTHGGQCRLTDEGRYRSQAPAPPRGAGAGGGGFDISNAGAATIGLLFVVGAWLLGGAAYGLAVIGFLVGSALLIVILLPVLKVLGWVAVFLLKVLAVLAALVIALAVVGALFA